MSDPVENFEFVLQNRRNKRLLPIYNENETPKHHAYRPQDVISSVSSQLKAIQMADFVNSDKRKCSKELNNNKQSTFLCINKLPVYEQVPKQLPKFDTQFVTDTQLINIIEDVELLDAHQGISQEFETTFIHDPEEKKNFVKLKIKGICDKKESITSTVKTNIDTCSNNVTNENATKAINDSLDINNSNIIKETQSNYRTDTVNLREHTKIPKNTTLNSVEYIKDVKSQVSQILTLNTSFKRIDLNSNIQHIKQTEEHCQVITECTDIQDDDGINRPVSPILHNKDLKVNSYPPSPLIFNLDQFEQFERIVAPLIDSKAFEKAECVINSQILNKELCIKINEDIELNMKNNIGLVMNKYYDLSLVQNKETKQIPIDKATSEKIIGQLTHNSEKFGRTTEDLSDNVLNDEILFSSDEEEDIANEVHDLRFTSALETSFHNQSDNVDKTMYVGFQTASNRSIQVNADSFAKAKYLLNDVSDNEVTVTELVQNSENISKKYSEDRQIMIDINENKIRYLDENLGECSRVNTTAKDNAHKIVSPESDNKNSQHSVLLKSQGVLHNTKFLGFRTANNIKINPSKNGLARCKKVFQDINLNENFEVTQKYSQKDRDCKVYDKINEQYFESSKVRNLMDGLQGIDAEIIEEFENTDMYSEKDKKENIATVSTDSKMSFSGDIHIAHMNSKNAVFTDNACAGNFQQNSENHKYIEDAAMSLVSGGSKSKNDFSKLNVLGFKTASNKNINISKNAWVKSKNVFQDIDLALDHKNIIESHNFKAHELNKIQDVNSGKIDLRNKEKALSKSVYDKSHILNIHEPNFMGFKTASDKNVKKSAEAWNKTRNLFNDIDSITLPNETKRHYPEIDSIQEINHKEILNINNVYTKYNGFKCGNKVHIDTSASIEKIAKTSNPSEDIDTVVDFSDNIDLIEVSQTYQKQTEEDVMGNCKAIYGDDKVCLPVKDIPKFIGFKTASNKNIEVSSEALLRSKKMFNDVDHNNDFDMKNKIYDELESSSKISANNKCDEKLKTISGSPFLKGFQTANNNLITISEKAVEEGKKLFDRLDKPTLLDMSVNTGFSGFKTASNKQVKISEKALVKSKNIFNDVDLLSVNSGEIKNIKTKSLYPEEIYQNDDMQTLNKKSNKTSTIFKGFHTASRKPVTISKSALENSRKIFQDIQNTNQANVNFCEFEANNNSVEHSIDISKIQGCKGFQTASNKKVIVSEKALAETKTIFRDIENEVRQDLKMNSGFHTSNNRAIDVSTEALANAKRLFSEIDAEKHIISTKKGKTEIHNIIYEENNIDSLIDTQVINHFDDALHTEDFRETPKKSKRSGSPILFCTKTKKRKKFETPYNHNIKSKVIPKPCNTTKQEKKIIYRENYKKNKKYTLKDLKELTKDKYAKIDTYLFKFNYDSLLKFEFNHDRNDLSCGIMTIDLLKEYFLSSINSNLVPDGWIDNHIRLILWKLISYEVVFKSVMCTAKNVLEQLNYRYEKELYNAERPALRKILEKDDVLSKTLVLCVVEIYADGINVSRITNPTSNVELLVTDGWYCVRCTIDKMLAELVSSNKVTVGSKIITTGAELMGCEQGVSPWENTSVVRLKIFGNSTRRARWDTRLGYHGKCAILSHLSAVKVLGGKVSKLRVFVSRVYPALYVEKFEDGSTVTRSERLENIHQVKTEADRQAFMEKLYEEIEKEFADKESQDSEGLPDSWKRIVLDSGSQIAKMMKRSKDPGEFRAQLTNTQICLLEEHTSKEQEKLLQEIQTRVKERIEQAGVCVNRNVVSLLKIRIAGIRDREDNVVVTKGMMSIWKPNDEVREIIKEGAWIDVMNVVPTSIRYGEIQISAGRQSVFSASKFKPSEKVKHYVNLLLRHCYTIKDLVQNPAMSTNYNEIDTVGLIFLIDPAKDVFDSTKQSFQNIYLSDADKNIICINFWGGLKKFGFQNVLDTGQVVSCVNLQKRAGNTRKSIPQYRVTEFSYFTHTPRNVNAKKMLEELNKKMTVLDRRKFCQECLVLKNNYSVQKQSNENVSPYRCINLSDVNMSKNKIFIDSPLEKVEIQDNFNLTGLDFESSFKEDTHLSEEALKRRRKVNEKIAKLKMYGEPPPLSPMHIINTSKRASNSYKSPLITNANKSNIVIPNNTPKNVYEKCSNPHLKSDGDNIVHVKNTPVKRGEIGCEISNSPVILNKTFVKTVNPVKINFNLKDNNDSSIDHFAEEFDGSPPLSLD